MEAAASSDSVFKRGYERQKRKSSVSFKFGKKVLKIHFFKRSFFLISKNTNFLLRSFFYKIQNFFLEKKFRTFFWKKLQIFFWEKFQILFLKKMQILFEKNSKFCFWKKFQILFLEKFQTFFWKKIPNFVFEKNSKFFSEKKFQIFLILFKLKRYLSQSTLVLNFNQFKFEVWKSTKKMFEKVFVEMGLDWLVELRLERSEYFSGPCCVVFSHSLQIPH